MKKPVFAFIAAVLLSMGLIACGGSDSGTTTATVTATEDLVLPEQLEVVTNEN